MTLLHHVLVQGSRTENLATHVVRSTFCEMNGHLSTEERAEAGHWKKTGVMYGGVVALFSPARLPSVTPTSAVLPYPSEPSMMVVLVLHAVSCSRVTSFSGNRSTRALRL